MVLQSLKESKITQLIILAIILIVSAYFRITVYGDNYRSIGAVDTPVYIDAANRSWLNFDFLSAERPFTVPLVYKIFKPDGGYDLTAVSRPSVEGAPRDIIYQSGLDRVAVFQMLFSIFGWSCFASVLFLRMENLIAKVITAFLILFFAFCPQMAEWDRILLSESVSFSFFALVLALTLELSFRFVEEKDGFSKVTNVIIGFWCLVVGFWVFTRDTNAYILLVFIVMILGVWGISIYKGWYKKAPLILIFGYLIILLVVQQIGMRNSQRWVLPFLTNISVNVLPYDDRVNFFQQMGMPITDEILALDYGVGGESHFYEYPDFMTWVAKNGSSSYTRFLLDYPLWAMLELYNDVEGLFIENIQPWFTGPAENRPEWIIYLGSVLHSRSHVVVLADMLLTLVISISVWIKKDKIGISWVIFLFWLLICEFVLLFISYHGDPRSVIRHTLVAVMPLRMSLWLLIMVLFDRLVSLSKLKQFVTE